jgi:hypothetical protein
LKAGGGSAGFVFRQLRAAFIAHSRNKSRGTGDSSEHRASRVVVGAGNAICEEISMNNRLMVSVAALALIAGTGFANAQGTGMSREAPSAAPAQQSAPSSERGATGGEVNHDAKRPEMKTPGAANGQRAEDNAQPKSKTLSTQNADESGRDRDKTVGQSTNENRGEHNEMDKAQSIDKKMSNEAEGKNNRHSQTVGQAGAGAKLSTEQRTKITTVIHDQHIAPVEHVNFSISVGTRVPRDVTFHPLPTEVVTIYPEWRGYEFVLVGDQVVVIDPQSFEIVAVLDA